MKKLLCLLLAAAMLMALLSACAGGADKEAETSPPEEAVSSEPEQPAPSEETPVEEIPAEETPVESAKPEEEKELTFAEIGDYQVPELGGIELLPVVDEEFSFSFWHTIPPSDNSVSTQENSPWTTFIAELTGVTLLHYEVSITTESEKFNLMVASGDWLDVVTGFASKYNGGAELAYSEEIIMDLTELLETSAPNYMEYISKNELDLKDAYNDEGRMLTMNAYDVEMTNVNGLNIRADWLEQVGMEAPKTVAEFYNVLTAFKSELGADEPYFIASEGMTMCYAYNTNGYDFYQKDGVVYSSMNDPQMKEYLTEMNRWLNDGLIANDFFADTSSDFVAGQSEVLSGKTGAWFAMVNFIDNYNNNTVNPMSVIGIATPTAIEGDTIHFIGGTGATTGVTSVISTACLMCTKNAVENSEKIINFYDFMFTELGYAVCNYGIYGESYTIDENGDYAFTDLMLSNPDYTFNEACMLYTMIDQPCKVYRNRTMVSYSDVALSAVEAFASNKDTAYELPSQMTLTTEESEDFAKQYSDIETYCKETFNKFIVGELDIDVEWDAFVAQLTEMGLDQCVKMKQNALDRYNKR